MSSPYLRLSLRLLAWEASAKYYYRNIVSRFFATLFWTAEIEMWVELASLRLSLIHNSPHKEAEVPSPSSLPWVSSCIDFIFIQVEWPMVKCWSIIWDMTKLWRNQAPVNKTYVTEVSAMCVNMVWIWYQHSLNKTLKLQGLMISNYFKSNAIKRCQEHRTDHASRYTSVLRHICWIEVCCASCIYIILPA